MFFFRFLNAEVLKTDKIITDKTTMPSLLNQQNFEQYLKSLPSNPLYQAEMLYNLNLLNQNCKQLLNNEERLPFCSNSILPTENTFYNGSASLSNVTVSSASSMMSPSITNHVSPFFLPPFFNQINSAQISNTFALQQIAALQNSTFNNLNQQQLNDINGVNSSEITKEMFQNQSSILNLVLQNLSNLSPNLQKQKINFANNFENLLPSMLAIQQEHQQQQLKNLTKENELAKQIPISLCTISSVPSSSIVSPSFTTDYSISSTTTEHQKQQQQGAFLPFLSNSNNTALNCNSNMLNYYVPNINLNFNQNYTNAISCFNATTEMASVTTLAPPAVVSNSLFALDQNTNAKSLNTFDNIQESTNDLVIFFITLVIENLNFIHFKLLLILVLVYN